MGFQYQDSRSPLAGSIAELMLRRGDIAAQRAQQIAAAQARAAEVGGQAWAGAANQIGGAVSGAIQQATDPRRKLEAQQLEAGTLQMGEQKRAIAARDAFATIIKETPQLNEDGVSLYDIPAVAKRLAAVGQDPGAAVEHLGKINDAFRQEKAAKLSLVKTGAASIAAAGNDPVLASHFLDQLETNGTYPKDQVGQFRQFIAADPANTAKLTAYLMGPQKMERGAPGSVAVHPVTGMPVPGSEVPDETGKGDYTINGQRFRRDGTPIGSTVPPQAPKTAPSVEQQYLEAIGKGDTASAQTILRTLRDTAMAKRDPAAAAMATELGALRAEEAQARLQKIYEGKEPNQGQFTAAGYAGRIEQSGGILDQLQKNISGMNFAKFKVQEKLPSAFQSGDYQSYDQAARNLVNAILRRESGAAISESEFENARKQYLPLPGDTAQTLAQKKQNRDYVFKTMKDASGKAYEPPAGPPPPGAAAFSVGQVVEVRGKMIKITALHPDGTFDGDEVKK